MSEADQELFEVSESYVKISAELMKERIRADLWKSTALKMREHTSVVGVRLLRETIAHEDSL